MIRVGIIPARAGFTNMYDGGDADCRDHPRSRGVYDALALYEAALADHPRSRGVYACQVVASLWAAGSSPLARGLPQTCHK